MLLQYSIENFLSFKNKVTFSMASAADDSMAETHTTKFGSKSYGKVTAFYGANASGKSSFVDSLHFIKGFFINSNTLYENTKIRRHPFRLDKESEKAPSSFEITFVKDGVKYDYSFSCDDERVLSEFLYSYPKGKIKVLFERTGNDFNFGSAAGKALSILNLLKEANKKNQLFLVTGATTGNVSSFKPAFEYIMDDLVVPLGDTWSLPKKSIDEMIDGFEDFDEYKSFALKVFKEADFNIVDFDRFKKPVDKSDAVYQAVAHMKKAGLRLQDPPEEVTETFFMHNINGGKWAIKLEAQSTGTKTLYNSMPFLYDVLSKGRSLIVDEMECGLHPMLTEFIVKLFTNPEINKKNAQLIFTTHNTYLLDLDLLRRDQVWFFEKDPMTGISDLYPLTEFSPRKGENIQKGYLNGRYGAVPLISNKVNLW